MPLRSDITDELWRRGRLRFLFRGRETQLKLYDFIHKQKIHRTDRHVVAAFHRRCGKSYAAYALCVEQALAEPGSIIMYAAPSIKQVYGITKPIHRSIFETCPDNLKPKHDAKLDMFEFPNGSLMYMLAADMNKSDSARGKSCNLGVFDEAGFAKDPEALIKSVMTPAILHSDGMLLHISTPAETPSHPFCQRMRAAEGKPNYFKYTIDDNTMLPRAFIEECEKEMGGRSSTAFQREYLCEIVTEELRAVLPEMRYFRSSSPCIGVMPGATRIAVSIDFSGLTVAIACRKTDDMFEIFDERVVHNGNAQAVSECLRSLFEAHKIPERDRFVFAELDEAARNTVVANGGYPIATPQGFDPVASLGVLRAIIEKGNLSVAEAAPVTRRHLTDAIWNDTRTKYELSGDGGRFDGVVAALVGFHVAEPFRAPKDISIPWNTLENIGLRRRGPR